MKTLVMILVLSLLGVTLWGRLITQRESDHKVITWGIPDWPPYSVFPSSKEPPGIMNKLLNILNTNIPDYQFELIDASVPKSMELWSTGIDVCSPITLYTKERAALAYMTPWVLSPPLQIVVRADKFDLFLAQAKNRELDLNGLITSGRWKGLFVKNRSYGPPVDDVLHLHKGSVSIEPPVGSWWSVLNMVAVGRADFTVEYPLVVDEFNQSNAQSGALLSIPIVGYTKPFTFMVACTKSPKGKEWMEKIEKGIHSAAKKPEFKKMMERLFTPEGVKKYRSEIDEFVEKRKGP
ncbi:MAG: transporter substrate-binding domain-containing protein [Bdellovibrio sp.]|nr:transporter substrate-binding domain-containing protein [Bdellovibrio sp.]